MPRLHFLSFSRTAFVQCLATALCFLGINLPTVVAETPDNPLVVTVSGGQIRGTALPDNHGAVFKGIPFAQPPVGMLRWTEPQPVVAWKGIREAVKSGPPAAQASFGWNDRFARASQEDCLYLDVWTPTGPSRARKPVMVWVHGGGNVAGAGGADYLYDGASLISHDVVLVVIEYRLGIFGFFAHPELTRESAHHSSGNYGILDQIAALQWVHDNIAQFGGDPVNVTLFGQSSGSIDAMALLTSPLSRGLFHRLIAESGPLFPNLFRPLSEREQAGIHALEQLASVTTTDLAHLRSWTTEELLKVSMGGPAISIDGWVFPDNPATIIATGKAHAVPLIIGSNAIEFPGGKSLEEIKTNIQGFFQGLTPKLFAQYGITGSAVLPAADPVYGDLMDQWGSDPFRCIGVIQGGRHAAAGNPVWEYEFGRAIPPRPKVAHSGDLPYVFGNLYTHGDQAGEFQAVDHKLSENIQAYWTNFAKTGNPNSPGLPLWPNYQAESRKYLHFTANAEIRVDENERGPVCDLFRERFKTSAPATH